MSYSVLLLDLTDKTCEVIDRPDLREDYLGGAGAAIKLLQEFCPSGVDPLSPEAPIVFAIGPLNGFLPCCTKVVAMFKSPLTGSLGESHAGGRFGLAMKLAGYDAIVVEGAADFPTYITIRNGDVAFKDASALWGISTYSTGRVLREIEPDAGRRSIIRIGPAGENRVRYANVNVDMYRHFGRLGLGAVFGSKKLKAIVIAGTKSYSIPNPKKYREVYDKIYKEVAALEPMKKYHDLGTAENVMPLNAIGALPTRNFSAPRFEFAHRISGEHFAKELLVKKMACPGCPLECIHIASLRIEYAEGYEYGSITVPYDYEPIYALGSMLGVGSPDGVLRLIEKVDAYGLDAISTGVILAWATEAFRLGIITEKETAGLRLDWGNIDVYARAIERIVAMPNAFYRALARGVEVAASKYGGLDFAMALGKNEVAGYRCGLATVLGQLVGCRHSHLDNAGYSLDQKKPMPEDQIVRELMREEWWRCLVTSLVICLFARKIYRPEIVRDALSALGIELTEEELEELGRRIYREKMSFKFREGFDFRKLRIPKRFFETESASGFISEEKLKKALELYEREVKKVLES